ncbi:MAG: hypothetical protein IJF83_03260 [Methanobrevibacter sp.]|nr:hypothetical protein [Methanobrevibacter sp.]
MTRVNIKQDHNIPSGSLVCFDKNTGEKITIQLTTLAEDGVLIYPNDGLIEIGGPRPSIHYYTDNPPRTDEVTVFIDGFLSEYYELIIDVKKEYTYIAMTLKED